MKRFALAVATGLGLGFATVAAPVDAAILGWNVEYTGWWEADGGGSISGMFFAKEEDALDGIISIDEMTSWMWNWTGNDAVSAFSISSKDVNATTDFAPSFSVNGTPNQPVGLDFVDPDNLDQGSFISGSGDRILDLQALLVISFANNIESLSAGNPDTTLGTVTVSEPVPVPEPSIGLLVLVGVGLVGLKRRQQKGCHSECR
jgi:PEP-CTERM motif